MSDHDLTLVHHEPRPAAMERWTGLQMIVSPAEALRRVQELRAFVAEVMVPEEDFGVIPGTKKPTLYQPGAQKLGEMYGFSHRFVIAEKIEKWDEPMLFFYSVRCVLTSRHDDRFICEGLGSCNSKEDKYAWRWVGDRDLPRGIDKSTLKSKPSRNGQWQTYRLPNEDVASAVNTILKMACKRAYVHAIVSATRSAGIFTQDVEDLPREVYGQAERNRSWEGDEIEGEIVPTVPTEQAFAASIAAANDLATLDAIPRGIAAAYPEKTDPARIRLRELHAARRAELTKPAAPPADPIAEAAALVDAAALEGADIGELLRKLGRLDMAADLRAQYATAIRSGAV